MPVGEGGGVEKAQALVIYPDMVYENSNHVLDHRFDAVHVVPGPENGTFYARAMSLGEAVLKVSDVVSFQSISSRYGNFYYCNFFNL